MKTCVVCGHDVSLEWAESMDGFACIADGLAPGQEIDLERVERLAINGYLCSWDCFEKAEAGLA